MPVLAKDRTITGRLWTYVRDDHPFGGPAPPAAIFYYFRDQGGKHLCQRLARHAAILQADAHAGYNDLCAPGRTPNPITEAACRAHVRQKFYVLAETARAPIALQAVRRIDAIQSPLERRNSKQSAKKMSCWQHPEITNWRSHQVRCGSAV